MRIAVNASAELLHADIGRLREHAARAAEDGFSGWWLAQTGLVDALTVFPAVADGAPGLEFGTAVVPTFPRHPTMLAGQALTTQAVLGDRDLVLGIGQDATDLNEETRTALTRQFGVMFQYGALFNSLTIGQNIADSFPMNNLFKQPEKTFLFVGWKSRHIFIGQNTRFIKFNGKSHGLRG
jgi:hypothetical protein